MSAMYEARAPDGTLVLHRTTNTTKQEAVMVLFEIHGKWRAKDVDDGPLLICGRPYWLSNFTVAVRAWRVPRNRVPEPVPPPPVPPVASHPKAVPHTPEAPSEALKELVRYYYDPLESAICKRPMFRYGLLGDVVLEVFAQHHEVQPDAVVRVLEHFGLPAHPPPDWAERVVEELARLAIPVRK